MQCPLTVTRHMVCLIKGGMQIAGSKGSEGLISAMVKEYLLMDAFGEIMSVGEGNFEKRK